MQVFTVKQQSDAFVTPGFPVLTCYSVFIYITFVDLFVDCMYTQYDVFVHCIDFLKIIVCLYF